jgi:hypothetical protein
MNRGKKKGQGITPRPTNIGREVLFTSCPTATRPSLQSYTEGVSCSRFSATSRRISFEELA